MNSPSQDVTRFNAGTIKLEIHRNGKAAGEAAAQAAAEELRRLDRLGKEIAVIFATGASQLDTLEVLTSIPGLPWQNVLGFHLDEYVGLSENHPASFRHYLREKLTSRVAMRRFFEIDGNAADIEKYEQEYAHILEAMNPQLCLLGIGENGHLAFNDPSEADFYDPLPMKVVTLDNACQQQQVSEGWFASLDEVPQQALTLTIPTLFRVPKLIASVPGIRKATAVRRTLEDPITTDCPSTLLRTHPDVTIYLDAESASELSDVHLSTK
ncbi:glucosamine-6-phosphate deaminase [Acidicapsa ligni]|uniref:glucosamine-6-phosphate deaminase n=1 Tax=Acidicapsa ligni TaxID=542300 RepID=UPI0021E02EC1|nr:glucosamine-6-phosphate deaminase [Acidicapsa ligni]